ncbi:unnamed protein product [Orchesella dallaii]|uniref:Uncharacterized protein n=1 Tax=Orchesella dallaii TaxID=48710 RepID=A0ABP1PPG9_9HEXA
MDWHEFRKLLAYRILILVAAEIFRNVHKIFYLARPLGRQKQQKQDEAGGAEGSANTLATITDSFGGQLAGQIISVILSSVTGDVRGILGNSLNLFQTDDTRDRVQVFLDELSQNFLKFTGLGQLTSTMAPQYSTLQPILLGTANGANQLYQPAQAVPSSPGGGLRSPSTNALQLQGLGSVGAGGIGAISGATQQQGTAGAQPIIYVLPNLNNANANGATTATKPNTGNKRVTPATTIDDDSEEDRDRSYS